MISFGLSMKRKEKKERSFGWGEYLLRIEKFFLLALSFPRAIIEGVSMSLTIHLRKTIRGNWSIILTASKLPCYFWTRRFSDVEVTDGPKCNGLKISIPGTVRRNRAARYLVLSSFSLFHVYRGSQTPREPKGVVTTTDLCSCIHVHPLFRHTKKEREIMRLN